MTMEQAGFEGEGFNIGTSYILDNKESVADFFGDNRGWYLKLVGGGSTYGRVSIDSQADYEGVNDEDVPPLDPERINETRAKSIASFFVEYPDAKALFIEYSKKD